MGVAILGLTLLSLLSAGSTVTGAESVLGSTTGDDPNVTILARVLFTDYVYAFEITAILLTIAVVGAVVLARRLDTGDDLPADEPGQARR
jgi:NADH-quinone oxidoreductase subunit J